MKYRDHKGGYSESMKTVQEIKSVEDIKAHLEKRFTLFPQQKIAEIKFERTGIDHRNKWDSHYVLIRSVTETKFSCVGMTDGLPEGGQLI